MPRVVASTCHPINAQPRDLLGKIIRRSQPEPSHIFNTISPRAHLPLLLAMSVTALSKSLPKPKYTGEEEELTRSTRVLSVEQFDTQIARRQNGPPPYGSRKSWRPRTAEDFGDGGAFPEVHVAQYPLDMGKKGAPSTSNALVRRVDEEGKTKYDEIAKRGHSDSRIVQASFKDLIPLRQQANAGELDLSRPSQEVVQATKQKTEQALMALVAGQTAAQKPKNVQGRSSDEPTFVRYTPTAQMGEAQGKTRIFKIQQRQLDPWSRPNSSTSAYLADRPRHRARPALAAAQTDCRGPRNVEDPTAHQQLEESQGLHSAARQASSSRRSRSSGRYHQRQFAQFGEALQAADRHAREEVKQRAIMQQRLAEKEKLQKEEHLRNLAKQAREERANVSRRRSQSDSEETDSEEEAVRRRQNDRKERREDFQREMRQSRMGTERKMQMLAREQNRDISEKVALGLAKPTQSGESMYDSRLFNQSSGFNAGFNEDNHYDKPLFAAQDAISSIYRPSVQQDDGEDEGQTYDRITKSSKFEVLGKAKDGFKGADLQEEREGPVQFEKEVDDPFNINQMINEVRGEKSGDKRYGIQEAEGRSAKRARVDEDSD